MPASDTGHAVTMSSLCKLNKTTACLNMFKCWPRCHLRCPCAGQIDVAKEHKKFYWCCKTLGHAWLTVTYQDAKVS